MTNLGALALARYVSFENCTVLEQGRAEAKCGAPGSYSACNHCMLYEHYDKRLAGWQAAVRA